LTPPLPIHSSRCRPSLALVVPCYNEEERLDSHAFLDYLRRSVTVVRLIFVDDGSADATVDKLRQLVEQSAGGAELLQLGTNQGKAEAVRRGMLHALESHAYTTVGFWDSDLATPLSAVSQLEALLMERPALQMVFGARVALLGRHIKRSLKRHYAGRVFATLTSLVLDMPIYDTQCGAKLFRVTPALRTVLTQPFLTRWVFDVEMIARFAALYRESPSNRESEGAVEQDRASLVGGSGSASATIRSLADEAIFEFPLHQWVDVAGSKLKATDVLRMAYGLLRIYERYYLHEWPSGAPRVQAQAHARNTLAVIGVAAVLGLAMLFSLVSRWL